jgi:hypothetical protein
VRAACHASLPPVASRLKKSPATVPENERLQACQVKQSEAQSLFDSGEEGARWIDPSRFERALLERGSIAIQVWLMPPQELLFDGRTATHPGWNGMMPWHGVASVSFADQPRC